MDNFDAAGAVEKWWTSGNRARRPGFNPWQQEQEIRDDLYEDLVLMDQEAEQEENVRQEAISDELGLEAENVAAGEKRLAEALDDSDKSDIDESDIDTFLKDY
ncbi:hypothetical protein CgunFtcFv8_018180 [Champsocephalus gunnari]|uniref:Uncharacterized protein n=1 Tax=Champsocephalus gunnari TaxID=52237 RepID=A0AAN8HWC3_CHAGU|nr:hypothetical protein CgunFtcFv8_018180 [Champsocephalus gunnari]